MAPRTGQRLLRLMGLLRDKHRAPAGANRLSPHGHVDRASQNYRRQIRKPGLTSPPIMSPFLRVLWVQNFQNNNPHSSGHIDVHCSYYGIIKNPSCGITCWHTDKRPVSLPWMCSFRSLNIRGSHMKWEWSPPRAECTANRRPYM